jgi:hypothetical protein
MSFAPGIETTLNLPMKKGQEIMIAGAADELTDKVLITGHGGHRLVYAC